MEVFVGRQPILDRDEQVYGYELLYRNSKKNYFVPMDANQATSEVLKNSFFTIGLERLSENKPCFINFTEELLLEKVPEFFHPQQLVVEILEHVSFTKDLIRVCRELKEKGFLIALDDVVSVKETALIEVLNYIDIIKVDIQAVSEENRAEIIKLASTLEITLLAEKVETLEERDRCVQEGFHLFQGFYFSKPDIVTGMEIPFFHSTYFQVIKELSAPASSINIEKVTEYLGQDLSLTYKLLRLINTTNRQGMVPVHSIKQAVMLLGSEALKKWLYVLSIDQSTSSKLDAQQLVTKTSLLRAKMCEQIAIRHQSKGKADQYFLTGFLSMIDVITKRPMSEVIEQLPLDSAIKKALQGEQNSNRNILDVAIAMEKANFEYMDEHLGENEMDFSELFEIYGQAISWTDQLYQTHFSN